jgi:predicted component of type VI protein secretion system
MPKTARETSVAEVKFVDEPAAKRAREDEIDTPAKDVATEKHPLKMIQRGARSKRRHSPLRSTATARRRPVSATFQRRAGGKPASFPPDSARTLT